MTQSLNGGWTLTCLPEPAGKNPPFGVMPEMGPDLPTYLTDVPGEAQLTLLADGALPDPFYADNYYRYTDFENCGWMYQKTFRCETFPQGSRVRLTFGGVDTVADVFLNGVFLGHTENMLVEHSFDVTDALKQGEYNRISVHIFSALNYIRGKPYPVGVHGGADRIQLPYLRKAAHSVGWDIFPRMMTAGLWRDVTLEEEPPTRITQTYFSVSDADESAARLRWAVRFASDRDDLENFEIVIRGVCRDRDFGFTVKPLFPAVNGALNVARPYLWWPKGYGDANLYNVTTTLLYRGEPVDEKRERIGLRSVRLERDFTPGRQKFAFFVNGVPVFLRGTNHVPTDVFHSRAKGRVQKTVDLIDEIGCNALRSWGGGIYEDTLFYDLCDERGIFIWQDFAFGNALYPQDGSMDDNIRDEAVKLLRRIRSHPSVLLYSADNEIDMRYANMGYPDESKVYSRIANELLPGVIAQEDPYRQYLKSSPETPFGFTVNNVPEQHTWGARAWYKDDYYKHSTASFIGEAGYHGCPAPESLAKFIPEKDLWPIFNRSWAAHSTEDLRNHEGLDRIRMMAKQVKILCGKDPATLADLALVSQFAQGEAIKFFIERSLYLRPQRTGILWWNIVDGWPQISDAIVDYYYNKKLGFDFIRRAQQPVTAFFGECEGWVYPFVIANCSLTDAHVIYTVTDGDTGETLCAGEAFAPANRNTRVRGLELPVSEKRLLLIDYTVNGRRQQNHYITGFPPYSVETLRRWAEILQGLD